MCEDLRMMITHFAATFALVLFSTNSPGQVPADRLRGDLSVALDALGAQDLLPVTIVMKEQVPPADLLKLRTSLPKQQRRQAVVERLRELANRTQADLLALLEQGAQSGQVQSISPLWIHNVVNADVTRTVALDIAARDDVLYVHRDVHLPAEELLLTLPATPSVGSGNPTCGLTLIQAPSVWQQYGITGAGVVVGVIDTGVGRGHTDISKRLWRNPLEIPGNGIDDENNGFADDVQGWDFSNGNGNVRDGQGHGSHVAGTVAGDGTGGTACGVAPGTRIMVLKSDLDFGAEGEVWSMMQYGVANGADILTASLGWPHKNNPDRATWRAVCENTIAAGVVVIYAGGNEGKGNAPDNIRTPGDVPDVITVGAVTCGDEITNFSSRGPVTWQNVPPYNDHPYPPGLKKPDVAAPGNNTISHQKVSGYTQMSGTSMATPHVAGVAALILQADPSLDHFGVQNHLYTTAVDLGTKKKDNRYGWGRVDALAAVTQSLAAGNYCGAKPNSCGGIPIMWTEGNASVSSSAGFWVTAANLPAKSVAMLVYTDQGAATVPALGGNLCLASFARTVPIPAVGTPGLCDAIARIDMNAFGAGALGGSPAGYLQVPGTTIHAQFWCRDPQNSFATLLTGAVSYTIAP
ncbi:MAG: hypothetical protein CMJ61_06945 [Planctomycetaceae bacterium]|nr:hypothetical protein [Planctomycetaceae bacterium]